MSTVTETRTLAVDGGAPVRTAPWPSWPIWNDTEVRALTEVVNSGNWFGPTGTKVHEYVETWSRLHQAKHMVPCTNGTQALEIALRAAGVKAGDEVIVPPYTFIATASAVVQVNAIPVFADIDPDSYNLDPAAAEAAITDKTAALMPVHVAGLPADMDAFRDLASRKGLLLIEDAAQAHLAEWNGTPVGALGDAGIFSHQASKNLNGGEGGCILTNDDKLYDRAWSLVNAGRVREGGWYEHAFLSGNYRMTEWQGAILCAQITRLEEQTDRRNENGLHLAAGLEKIPGIRPLKRDARVTRHAYHLFCFRYDPSAFAGLSHEKFMKALNAEGIPCNRGYEPLYRSDAFRINPDTHPFPKDQDYASLRLPAVEQASEEAVWLRQSLLLAKRADMDDIVTAVAKIHAAATGG